MLQHGRTEQTFLDHTQHEPRPHTSHISPHRNRHQNEQVDPPIGEYDYYFPSRDNAIESGKEEVYRRHREPMHHRRDGRIRTAVREDRPQERLSRNDRRPKSHNAVESHRRRHSGERKRRERPHSSTRRREHGRDSHREEYFDQIDAQNTDDDFPFRHFDDVDDREVVQSPSRRDHQRRARHVEVA